MIESLKQFRDRHPAATILSEVLMVQGEQFVVKVTIETQAAGVASGLAADLNLEVAEDRARTRALAALGVAFEDLSQPIAAKNTASATSDSNGWNAPEDLPLVVPQEPLDEVTSAQPALGQAEEVTHRAASTKKPVVAVKAQVKPLPSPAQQEDNEPASQPTGESTSQSLEGPLVLPDPINLSDVIAQTDIELRRLQWTVDDGREYLERTYSKRSRHELTEEELIEFLCHLESLPEPEFSP